MTAAVFVTLTLSDAEHWPELGQRARELGAHAAVLQGEGISLVAMLDQLVNAGITDVALFGVTFGETGVPASWVGRVARWWLSLEQRAVRVRFWPRTIRGLPESVPAVFGVKPLNPDPECLTSPEWADPPPISKHLLVCRGPRCTAKGAEALIAELGAELYRRGLLDEEVLVTQTGCLYPCNRAPVVAIQPDMRWVGPVGSDDVRAVVDALTPSGLSGESEVETRP